MVLDEEEALSAEVVLTIWAAVQGKPGGTAKGSAERSLQDAVEVTIPRRVQAVDINKYFELAFGDTFEPLPEAAQGRYIIVCARKTADAIRRGITIRGEEVKAQPKKKKREREDSR